MRLRDTYMRKPMNAPSTLREGESIMGLTHDIEEQYDGLLKPSESYTPPRLYTVMNITGAVY